MSNLDKKPTKEEVERAARLLGLSPVTIRCRVSKQRMDWSIAMSLPRQDAVRAARRARTDYHKDFRIKRGREV